jgi:hypothetical protein
MFRVRDPLYVHIAKVFEAMTILIHFLQSVYRNFKAHYGEYVLPHLRSEFPGLVSYTPFVDFIPSALIAPCAYFQQTCLGDCTGVSFIDCTSLDVCLNTNQCIASQKVFAGSAGRGKTSTGWFFGFKLHLVINDRGELLNALLTPGNVDDRKPFRNWSASCSISSLVITAISRKSFTNLCSMPSVCNW